MDRRLVFIDQEGLGGILLMRVVRVRVERVLLAQAHTTRAMPTRARIQTQQEASPPVNPPIEEVIRMFLILIGKDISDVNLLFRKELESEEEG